MATLATFFKRSDAVTLTATSANDLRRDSARSQADQFTLRALPNDDIYFYAKRIDNSRVVRQADPAAGGQCWSAVGAAAILLILGGSIIAPAAGSVLAGYKLEALKQERQSLLDQKRSLEVKEAALLSPGRLNALALARKLASPGVDQVIHLDSPSEGSVASMQFGPAPAKGAAVSAR